MLAGSLYHTQHDGAASFKIKYHTNIIKQHHIYLTLKALASVHNIYQELLLDISSWAG